jgi:hypothetical protein
VLQEGQRSNEIVRAIARLGMVFESAPGYLDLFIQSSEASAGQGAAYVEQRLSAEFSDWADYIDFERAYQ